MAIVQNPIIGAARKKFGTAVFYRLYGKNIIRTKPVNIKKSQSPALIALRLKFTTVTKLVLQVLPIIRSVYGSSVKNMTAYNKVVSINMKNAFTGEPPVLDHTKFVFCDLEGSTISDVEITAKPDHVLEVTWDPNTVNTEEMSSLLTFILINCTTNRVMVYRDLVARNAGSVSITAPSEWAGAMTALHVLTYDYSQIVSENPQGIIKFKHGCDAASTVQ